MLQSIGLYFKLINVSIRSQLQYKASFIMLSIAHFFATLVDILGIWVLFDRFHIINGWTLQELAILYGVLHMGFAFSEAIARGIDTFSLLVKNGDFDRVLLRPLGTLFQISAREVQLMRIGRFLQGLMVMVWGFYQNGWAFISWHTLIIFFSFIGIVCLFYGLFVLQATLSFWTIETLELMHVTTYGGVESGQYPMSIYPAPFRIFFTVVIPLACVSYYPVATMLHHETLPTWMAAILPATGILFLYICCQIWKIGVRHYHSTGH